MVKNHRRSSSKKQGEKRLMRFSDCSPLGFLHLRPGKGEVIVYDRMCFVNKFLLYFYTLIYI